MNSRLFIACIVVAGLIAVAPAFAGTATIDFDSGVGPLDFKFSGSGDLTASAGRAVFTGSNVTFLGDMGAPQSSSGSVTARMTIQPAQDAANSVGLIMVNSSDTTEVVTALVSFDGTVSLVDWIGNFRNVQFFAPNAVNNVLILEYNANTERATLTINPNTQDEDSVFLDVALNGANNVFVGVAANGAGGFEDFSATGPGLLDYPPVVVDPQVTNTFGQGFSEEGAPLALSVTISDATPPLTYQWMFDGSPIGDSPPHITGATTGTLFIDGLIQSDSGTYQLEFSDASKAGPFLSPPIVVTVVVAGSLPVVGVLGLATALIALGAIGSRALLRY